MGYQRDCSCIAIILANKKSDLLNEEGVWKWIKEISDFEWSA